MQVVNELGLIYWIVMIAIAVLVYAGKTVWWDNKLSEERESMTEIMNDVVKVVREKYNTENITLLKELKDGEGYLKYQLLVEDEIKQVIYLKDTSEIVIIEQGC